MLTSKIWKVLMREEGSDVFNSRMSRFLEDVEDTTEFDQIDLVIYGVMKLK